MTQRNKVPAYAPYQPAEWEEADANAIQAVAAGKANEDQQKRALDWIINNACGTYNLSFCPGEDGERQTAMAEGRRFVGLQIIKMIKLNAALLRKPK